MTRREFFDALVDAADRDTRIWLLTADLGHGLIETFAERFPDRFLNCGVREQAMVGIAAGLARAGKMPFCYSHANFLVYRALEFIRNDVMEPRLPVRLVGVGFDGAYPDAGFTHHASDEGIRCVFDGAVCGTGGEYQIFETTHYDRHDIGELDLLPKSPCFFALR